MDATRYQQERVVALNASALAAAPFNHSKIVRRDEQLAKVEIGVQAVIFCMALFGNTCVLLALRYRRKKTSRMHLFIMHLSIADLLVAFLNILPQLAWDITYRFQGNDFLCRVVKYFQVMVMYLSTYVLVMTAIDRYRAICHPLSNYSWSAKRVHIMVAIAYAISVVLSIPQVAIFRMVETEPGGEVDCWAHFEPEWSVTLYITFFAISIYIVPFLLLTALYGRICYVVWKNVHRKRTGHNDANHHDGKVVYKFNGTGTISVIAPNGANSRESSQRHQMTPRTHSVRGFSRSKMKTIKLTFVVIIAYMICWSPFFVAQMWWAYDEKAPLNNSTFVVCLLLASLNSCCNPWIYMAFSGGLIQQLVPCCRPPRHPPRMRHERVRVRSVVEVDSKSSSSEDDDPDKIPMEHRRHGNQCYFDNTLSHTSLTKVTAGTFSPTSSLKSRQSICCMHRGCHVNSSPVNIQTGSKDKRNRHGHTKELTCRCLHEIKEEGLGDKCDNVFYDLSLARKSRKTTSQPSLVVPSISFSGDKVDTRCTISA